MYQIFLVPVLMLGSENLRINQDPVRSCLLFDDLASPFSIALSRDGRRLAVGGGTQKGGDWKLFDLEKGECLIHGKQRCFGGWAVRISPSDSFIAYGGNYNYFYLVDGKTGKLYWDLTKEGHVGVIHSLEFTPDEKYLISMDPRDSTIRTWDIKAKKAHASFRFTSIFPGLNQWQDSRYVETAKHVFHVDGKYSPIDGSALTPDGKLLAVAGNIDGKVPFLDPTSGKLTRTIQLKQPEATCLQFTPDGKWLVAGITWKHNKRVSKEGLPTWDPKGGVEIWNLEKNELITSLGKHESSVSHVAMSPDKKTVISGGVADGFRVWDVATGKQKYSYFTNQDPRTARVKISPDDGSKFVQKEIRSAGCAFLPGGETFIIVPAWSLWNTEIYFYDTATGTPIDHREAYKRMPARPKNVERDGR